MTTTRKVSGPINGAMLVYYSAHSDSCFQLYENRQKRFVFFCHSRIWALHLIGDALQQQQQNICIPSKEPPILRHR